MDQEQVASVAGVWRAEGMGRELSSECAPSPRPMDLQETWNPESMSLDGDKYIFILEHKSTFLSSLTSKRNLAFPSVMNVGKE